MKLKWKYTQHLCVLVSLLFMTAFFVWSLNRETPVPVDGTAMLKAVKAEASAGDVAGYKDIVAPFFEKHCIRCHGPVKSKGKITVHSLDGDLSAGQELERWEAILDVLEHGEMPPEDEPQPIDAEREQVAAWIESGMRDYVTHASKEAPEPTARRLTNVEYQNTMNDLLGFELNLIQNLPEDPVKPYHFNNTAHFMLIGPEQMDRYKENARLAMASAIVDPGEPMVYTKSAKWDAKNVGKGGLTQAEIGVYQGPGVGNKVVGLNA